MIHAIKSVINLCSALKGPVLDQFPLLGPTLLAVRGFLIQQKNSLHTTCDDKSAPGIRIIIRKVCIRSLQKVYTK